MAVDAKMISASATLVKYDNPVLISRTTDRKATTRVRQLRLVLGMSTILVVEALE